MKEEYYARICCAFMGAVVGLIGGERLSYYGNTVTSIYEKRIESTPGNFIIMNLKNERKVTKLREPEGHLKSLDDIKAEEQLRLDSKFYRITQELER